MSARSVDTKTTNEFPVLVIDDLRRFPDWMNGIKPFYARDSDTAIAMLAKRDWWQVWFDHDLGDGDDTRRVVYWIEEHKPNIRSVVVHSMNPVGAEWIAKALTRAGYKVTRGMNDYLKVWP